MPSMWNNPASTRIDILVDVYEHLEILSLFYKIMKYRQKNSVMFIKGQARNKNDFRGGWGICFRGVQLLESVFPFTLNWLHFDFASSAGHTLKISINFVISRSRRKRKIGIWTNCQDESLCMFQNLLWEAGQLLENLRRHLHIEMGESNCLTLPPLGWNVQIQNMCVHVQYVYMSSMLGVCKVK